VRGLDSPQPLRGPHPVGCGRLIVATDDTGTVVWSSDYLPLVNLGGLTYTPHCGEQLMKFSGISATRPAPICPLDLPLSRP